MPERQSPQYSGDALRRQEEQQRLDALFSHIPVGYQERFRPYILGGALHINQRQFLVEEAAKAGDSQELDKLLEQAKAWELEEWRKTHSLGKVVIRGDLNEPLSSAEDFLQQVLGDASEVIPDPAREGGGASTAEVSVSGNVISSPLQPQSTVPVQPEALVSHEAVHTKLLFADFKKVLKHERQAVFSEEPDKLFDSLAEETRNPYDEKLIQRVINTAINSKTQHSFLGNDAIPDELVEPIARALWLTSRGKVINFPPQFSPNKLEQALEASVFEPMPLDNERPVSIPASDIQLSPAAITSIKIATREGGRIVDLPTSRQPQNLSQFFKSQLGDALTPEVFEVLKGKREDGRIHTRTSVEEIRFGALKNGALGVELVIRQPEIGVDNKEEFARLGAVLLGQFTLANFAVGAVKIY